MRRISIIRNLVFATLVCLATTAVAESNQLASLDNTTPYEIVTPDALEAALSHLDGRLAVYPQDHEASLLKSLLYLRVGDLDKAITNLKALRERAPDFHLAHLMYGDLLMARVHQISDIGNPDLFPSLPREAREKLDGLQEEARYRLGVHLSSSWHNQIPASLITLSSSIKHAIVVDKSKHRLYVFSNEDENAPPRLVRDFYVSTGKKEGNKQVKGDLKTPEGVYFVTSWLADDKLPDKYGVGAFPVNYPNELDKKNGKTGYGIWLHGTDKSFYSRPPLDSEGCVVLTNMDFKKVKGVIKPGVTPVVITSRINWIDKTHWQQQREEIFNTLENWRQDWESLDVNRYLSHYAQDFWSNSHDYVSWSSRKRYLARAKQFQKVKFSDVSIFSYPKSENTEDDMVVVRLHQQYQSNNFNGDMYKRLYLARREQDWRILYEGR